MEKYISFTNKALIVLIHIIKKFKINAFPYHIPLILPCNN